MPSKTQHQEKYAVFYTGRERDTVEFRNALPVSEGPGFHNRSCSALFELPCTTMYAVKSHEVSTESRFAKE